MSLLWKNGKEDILQKIENIDVYSIPIEKIGEAKILLDKYSEKEARESSIGIAGFYRWVNISYWNI